MNNNYKYFAFISYNREDEEWAIWLQHELEHYQLPDNLKNREDLPQEFHPVFRDVDELKAGELPKQIYRALESSMHLIVICSPRAVNSEWVNKEITDFIAIGNNKGVDNFERIFPFIIEGAPDAQDEAQRCFPKALCDLLEKNTTEILGGNVNENGRDRAFVKVMAGMLPDVELNDLWNRYERDKAEEERRKREERDKLLTAQSRFVAEKAQKLIDEGDTDLAIKLALEVLPQDVNNPNRPYCVEAESALRKAIWYENSYRVIRGHDDQVIFSRFSPNDERIVSYSLDGTLRIWDTNDGRKLFSKALSGGARSFVFNSEDDSAFLTTPDGVLEYIDVEKGQCAMSSDHKAYARCRYEFDKVLLKRLGKALLFKKGGFYLLDLETKELKLIINDCPEVKRFSISYDGCVIQCLCSDNTYKSWNLQGTKLIEYKASEPDRIELYSPNGKHLLLSSQKVVDCETGNEVFVFMNNMNSSIRKATFSDDGRFLAFSTYKKSLVWDAKYNNYVVLDNAIGEVNDFSFSHNGEILLCSAVDGTIKMVAINTIQRDRFGEEKGREISLYRHVDDVNRIRFISNGQKLISSSLCSIIVWDIKNEKRIGYYPNVGDSGHEISLDKKEELLVTTWKKEGPREPWNVLTINILTGEAERFFDVKESARYYHPIISPDGNFVASIYYASQETIELRYGVILWDFDTKKEYYTFRHNATEYDIYGFEFSDDGSLLVTCTTRSIILWDIKNKKKLLTKRDSILKQTPLLFFYDKDCMGGSIVYIADNHRVKIYDIGNDETIELKGHTENVMSMAADSKGKILATVSLDKTIKIWNIQTGEKLNTLSGHEGCVNGISFNQNGSLLASASDDGTIRVWDIQTGTNLEIIKAHYGSVGTVCFSPDGSMLASGGIYDFAVRVWEYPSLQVLIDKYKERYKNCPLTINEKTKYYLE